MPLAANSDAQPAASVQGNGRATVERVEQQPGLHTQIATGGAAEQCMNSSDAEMLSNTSDQHRQQPHSYAPHSDAPSVAQPQPHAQSHSHKHQQASADMHGRSDRQLPTDTCYPPAEDHCHPDLTLHEDAVRCGETLEVDLGDNHDPVQKPDIHMQHNRVLQYSQLPNTKPLSVIEPVHCKPSLHFSSIVPAKPATEVALHSSPVAQTTANALSALDAVVADSDSE